MPVLYKRHFGVTKEWKTRQAHTTAYEKCLPKKIKPKSIEVSNTKKY